jgi:hypothetical protein
VSLVKRTVATSPLQGVTFDRSVTIWFQVNPPSIERKIPDPRPPAKPTPVVAKFGASARLAKGASKVLSHRAPASLDR